MLWGEINRFLQTSRIPLIAPQGPLKVNFQEIKKYVKGELCPISYVKGMVASQDTIAAMQGHHVAKTGDGVWRTLFVADEASSVPDQYMTMARTWANRVLVIGNTWPCDNFFKHAVKGKPGTEDRGGDIPRSTGDGQGADGASQPSGSAGFHRRVIHIRAVDSPNVRLALAEQALGRQPTGRMVVPGVKDWNEYQRNLATWDQHQQSVSLNAEFYEGKEVMMYPREWLDRAHMRALALRGAKRVARAIGCDPGEGGADSAWAIVDELGLIDLVFEKTPDTSVIPRRTLQLMRQHKVPADRVVFDRGGGGKQHADTLRSICTLEHPRGCKVRTVAFGENPSLDPRAGRTPLKDRKDTKEDRYAYKNRRAELFGELRIVLDPAGGVRVGDSLIGGESGFGLPLEQVELRRQLEPIPLQYDGEGRMELPPKNRRPGQDDKKVTLVDLIGCSPDHADALVLAVHGMLHKGTKMIAGVGSGGSN